MKCMLMKGSGDTNNYSSMQIGCTTLTPHSDSRREIPPYMWHYVFPVLIYYGQQCTRNVICYATSLGMFRCGMWKTLGYKISMLCFSLNWLWRQVTVIINFSAKSCYMHLLTTALLSACQCMRCPPICRAVLDPDCPVKYIAELIFY